MATRPPCPPPPGPPHALTSLEVTVSRSAEVSTSRSSARTARSVGSVGSGEPGRTDSKSAMANHSLRQLCSESSAAAYSCAQASAGPPGMCPPWAASSQARCSSCSTALDTSTGTLSPLRGRSHASTSSSAPCPPSPSTTRLRSQCPPCCPTPPHPEPLSKSHPCTPYPRRRPQECTAPRPWRCPRPRAHG